MQRMMNRLGVTLCCAMFTANVFAQRTVVVETNLPSAYVFADTLWLGTAAQSTFSVPNETRELRLVPVEADGWSVKPQVAMLPAEGDSIHVDLGFAYHYSFASVPYGAPVFLEQDGQPRQ